MIHPTVFHADVDSFYASVEQRDNRRLRRKPVIVGGGVVLAASYEAKRCGVRSGMGGRRARELCPDAVVVAPRMEAYTEASRAMFEVFEDATPVVEAMSIDEAFLDVRGMRRIAGSPLAMAARLRRDVREQVGINITVGVARTKFLAKVASGVAKPDGLLLIPPAAERGFLHPLPVERLWGVGAVTAGKLHAHGLTTVRDVAAVEEDVLVALLGRAAGRQLHALAHGRDPRPVQRRRRRRSIGAQRALGSRRRSAEEIDAVLVGLVERVGGRLRKADRVCRTVVLRLRFSDYSRATRSHTLFEATARNGDILAAVRALHAGARPLIEERGLTLIGIALGNLDADPMQLSLPVDGHGSTALDATLDTVRRRYGSTAIQRAVLLGRDPHQTVPLLPD